MYYINGKYKRYNNQEYNSEEKYIWIIIGRILIVNFSDCSVTSVEMIAFPSILCTHFSILHFGRWSEHGENLSFQNQSHCFPWRIKSIRGSSFSKQRNKHR